MNVPVEVVQHRLPESKRSCPQCGTTMTEIGKDVRRSLVIVPAQVKIHEDWFYTYACQKCKLEGNARRKFDEAVNALPKPGQANSAAREGQRYCTKLFAIEKELAGLTPEKRYTKRLERENPFWTLC